MKQEYLSQLELCITRHTCAYMYPILASILNECLHSLIPQCKHESTGSIMVHVWLGDKKTKTLLGWFKTFVFFSSPL